MPDVEQFHRASEGLRKSKEKAQFHGVSTSAQREVSFSELALRPTFLALLAALPPRAPRVRQPLSRARGRGARERRGRARGDGGGGRGGRGGRDEDGGAVQDGGAESSTGGEELATFST